MHEMGIVQSIMDILEQQAQTHGAKRIVKVSLEFGALTAIMPESIRFAFEVLSRGTVAEGAELHVTMIPILARCYDCGHEQVMDQYQPHCPACESGALQIIQGRDEMRIASMEIED